MELVKRVSKRDIAITHHHLEINPARKVQSFQWGLKENGVSYRINWLIAMKAYPNICGMRKCDLCFCDKLLIARANSASLLNKHNEMLWTV